MRIVARAWATYQQLLITHPWKTQTIGTGVLVAAGDVVTQQFVERKGLKHDFFRTARMGVVGLIIGPVLRTWYLTLDRIVPGAAKTAGFKKMLLDQSLFAPVMICFFFGITETLAGKRLCDIKEMLQERYADALITNYKIWPLAQTLNFTFVPIQHRVGFVQIVAIFWNAYMSWMTNKPLPEPTLNSVNSIQ
ncbi:protein Mpv17-like [Orbicella faveolata]|uniref:protein Mpv17-like n=1 Tax=Orbicella faveolata TaxID=48498 RepID=UPI0009E64B9D|nr:protein Mpv17-like [Orbicella faveolata]XP_020610548.1 protein Mpv17-like [Orbicella faveolata]XP_020610549.1 protein Mpv17-like [Orbicella faveolata]XP_020610550.1 protein Mpv17-like [Orbicella faveolata]